MHLPCGGSGNNLFAFFRPPVNGFALAVINTVDDVRSCGTGPAAREHGVSKGRLFQGEFARSKVGIGKWAQRRADPGILGQLAQRIEARFETDPDHRGIFTPHKGIPHRDLPLVFVVGPLHSPLPEHARTATDADQPVVQCPVLHDRPGEDAFFEGCGIEQGDKSRAQRTAALHAAVVFAVTKITTAHHDDDTAAEVVEHEDGSLQVGRGHGIGSTRLRRARVIAEAELLECFVGITRPFLDFGEPSLQCALSHALHLRINGGVNAESAIHGPLKTKRSNGLLADVVERVRLFDRPGPLANHQLVRHRFLIFEAGEKAHVAHLPEHDIAIFTGTCGIGPGRKTVRALEKAGQGGRLRSCKFRSGNPEIAPRRRLRTVKTAAEVDAVEIHLHDFFLGKFFLDLHG